MVQEGVPLRKKLSDIFEPHMVDWLLEEVINSDGEVNKLISMAKTQSSWDTFFPFF